MPCAQNPIRQSAILEVGVFIYILSLWYVNLELFALILEGILIGIETSL